MADDIQKAPPQQQAPQTQEQRLQSLLSNRPQSLKELIAALDDQSAERFGMHPLLRLPAFLIATAGITLPLGAYQGAKIAGLRYLAENSHRLPANVQGWYFYHKRKNYVMIFSSMKECARFTAAGLLFTSTLFGIEAALDGIRGQIDCLNTTAGASVVGLFYAKRCMFACLLTKFPDTY